MGSRVARLPSIRGIYTFVAVVKLEPGGGGYSQKNWVGVCGPLPKTLDLFMTKT